MSAEDEARRAVTVDQAAFELPGVRAKVGRLLNSPGGRDLQNYVTGRLRRGEPWDPEDTRRVLELAGEGHLVARAVASIVQLRAAGAVERDREARGRVHMKLQTLDAVAIVVIGRLKRERVR